MRRALGYAWMLCMVLVLSGAVHADSYEYDELGNLKTLTTPRGVRGYTYDEIQRLDTETGYTGHRDHAYDLNGNRTTDGASASGTPTTATYSANTNRIATINGATVTTDAAGQITNDGLNSYTWDDAGRLKTVSRGGQLRATYYYDHKHRRTRKVTTAASPQGALTVVYHYDDQDRLITETTHTGTPIRSYAWSDENLIGQVEYVANATNTGYEIGRIVYYELDHLGTPRQARERTGTVVWRWESDGYGNTAADEDPDGNGQLTKVYLRFPGQYFDEESGLHYNWHRYYAPRIGRYLSSDPLGIQAGANTFDYARLNPANNVDTDGRQVVGVPLRSPVHVVRDVAMREVLENMSNLPFPTVHTQGGYPGVNVPAGIPVLTLPGKPNCWLSCPNVGIHCRAGDTGSTLESMRSPGCFEVCSRFGVSAR